MKKSLLLIFLATIVLAGCATMQSSKPVINYDVASWFFSKYQMIRSPDQRYAWTRYSNDTIIWSWVYMKLRWNHYVSTHFWSSPKNNVITEFNWKVYNTNDNYDAYFVYWDNIAYTQCSDLMYDSIEKSNVCVSNMIFINDKLIYKRDMNEFSDKSEFSIYSPQILYFDDNELIYKAFFDDSKEWAFDWWDRYFKYDIKSNKISQIDLSNIQWDPSFFGSHILSHTTRNLDNALTNLNFFLDGKPYYDWGSAINFANIDSWNRIVTLMKGDDVYFVLYYDSNIWHSKYHNKMAVFYKNKQKIFEIREDDTHSTSFPYLTDWDDDHCIIATDLGQGIWACVFKNSIFYYSLDWEKWWQNWDYFVDWVKINFWEQFITWDILSWYTSLIMSAYPITNDAGKIDKIIFSSLWNIYLSNYLGDWEISTPQVLVSNLPWRLWSRLLWVLKK